MTTNNTNYFFFNSPSLIKHTTETNITFHERRYLCGGNRQHKHNVRNFNRAGRQVTKRFLKALCD